MNPRLKAMTATLLCACVSVALLCVPTAATADTPGCITRAEFGKVELGMAKTRVHRIFDTSGVQISQSGNFEHRAYEKCQEFKPLAFIQYVDGHVTDKLWE